MKPGSLSQTVKLMTTRTAKRVVITATCMPSIMTNHRVTIAVKSTTPMYAAFVIKYPNTMRITVRT